MRIKSLNFSILILLVFASLFLLVSDVNSRESAYGIERLPESADLVELKHSLNRKIGPKDSVMLVAPDGRELYSKNKTRSLIPASTLKLLTSLAVFHFLGESHRFVTEFYLDDESNLKIKGYGDPFLVSEAVEEIAMDLKKQIQSCRNLVLDNSYFETPIHIPGKSVSLQPYDSPNGALCVNFNTVFFKKENGVFVSAEDQTPLLPLALRKIEGAGLSRGRILLSSDRNETTLYAGELIHYFLVKHGIRFSGSIRLGKIDPSKDRLILAHYSKLALPELVSSLLEYSNNFIANQLLITIGTAQHGPPGSLEKGVLAVERYIADELKITDMRFVEGSGISRENLMSADVMHKILEEFKAYHKLMRKNGREYYKTGHLNGIRTRAGYIQGKNKDDLYSFVVFINTPGKTTNPLMADIVRLVDHLDI